MKALLNVELPVDPYLATHTARVGKPDLLRSTHERSRQPCFHRREEPRHNRSRNESLIKSLIDAAQDSFRRNLQGIYFRQNLKFAGIGMAITLVWALITAMFIKDQSRCSWRSGCLCSPPLRVGDWRLLYFKAHASKHAAEGNKRIAAIAFLYRAGCAYLLLCPARRPWFCAGVVDGCAVQQHRLRHHARSHRARSVA